MRRSIVELCVADHRNDPATCWPISKSAQRQRGMQAREHRDRTALLSCQRVFRRRTSRRQVRHDFRLPDVQAYQARYLRQRLALSISLSEIPFARAHASIAASPYWATALLTAQQGMACAGHEASSATTITTTRIICRESP